jgi:hypothetical protein
MTLRGAADAAVARHLRHGIHIDRQEEDALAYASSRQCRLAARVTRSDYYYVMFAHG